MDATISPKRLVTELKQTATSLLFARDVCGAEASSAALFNIQYLTKTKESVGKNNKAGSANDVHHG